MNITTTEVYEREACVTCGLVFFIPAGLQRHRKYDLATFYCPNGHAQSYKKGEAEKLQDRVTGLESAYEGSRVRADRLWRRVRQLQGQLRAARAKAKR